MTTQTTPEECRPPDGTEDFTMHWLSREVGDGSKRESFEAIWSGGMWQTKGTHALSPRKAAWATWQYEAKKIDRAVEQTHV